MENPRSRPPAPSVHAPLGLRPSAEEIRQAIDRLRRTDLLRVDAASLERGIEPLFRNYMKVCPRIPPGLMLFRIRRLSGSQPSHLREISHPPPTAVTTWQRANRPGVPMFYCTNAKPAAFFEARPRVGDRFVLSRWMTTAVLLVNHVGYTDAALRILGTSRSDIGVGRDDRTIHTDEADAEVDTFLAEEFTKPVPHGTRFAHRYKLSAVIAERMIGGDILHGLMYPTVAMQGNAENFALKPSYVESSVEFVKASLVEITHVDGLKAKLNTLDTATRIDAHGSIQWKGHGDRWTLRKQGDEVRLIFEDGEWVGRDSDGNIVPPDE